MFTFGISTHTVRVLAHTGLRNQTARLRPNLFFQCIRGPEPGAIKPVTGSRY